MILILQGDRIAAVADEYEGPQDHVPAPEGFDLDRMAEYQVVGDTVALPVPSSLVPTSITRAQAKLALLTAGLLGNVQPAIDAITDPTQRTAAQIEWDDRLTFDRTNPTLMALATAMGMTGEQLDALFIAAAAL